MYIGWDWAAEAHDITVMDEAGVAVDRWTPEHDEAGQPGEEGSDLGQVGLS